MNNTWNGTGLPPAGTVCICTVKCDRYPHLKPIQAEVEHISERGAFLVSEELIGGSIGLPLEFLQFSLLPQELDRQQVIGEMRCAALKEGFHDTVEELFQKLYDAGFRKGEKP